MGEAPDVRDQGDCPSAEACARSCDQHAADPKAAGVTSRPRRNGKTLQAVEWFNEHCPVGTPVLYWPGVRVGAGRRSVTRSAAWMLGGHTPCVLVDGYPGGIALSHVMPVERQP